MGAIGSQFGLSATMVGVSIAIGKAVAKSGIPPLQKAGVIARGALIGGFGHWMTSAINRNNVNKESISNSNTNVSNFIDNSHTSPLETILYDVQSISITCLGLVFILGIQIVFKLYLKDAIKLNLFPLLGIKINNNL